MKSVPCLKSAQHHLIFLIIWYQHNWYFHHTPPAPPLSCSLTAFLNVIHQIWYFPLTTSVHVLSPDITTKPPQVVLYFSLLFVWWLQMYRLWWFSFPRPGTLSLVFISFNQDIPHAQVNALCCVDTFGVHTFNHKAVNSYGLCPVISITCIIYTSLNHLLLDQTSH